MALIFSKGHAAYQDPIYGFQGKITGELKYSNWRESAVYMQINGERHYTYIAEREIRDEITDELIQVYSVFPYSGRELLREQVRDFKKLKDAFAYVNARVARQRAKPSKVAAERRSPLVVFSSQRKSSP